MIFNPTISVPNSPRWLHCPPVSAGIRQCAHFDTSGWGLTRWCWRVLVWALRTSARDLLDYFLVHLNFDFYRFLIKIIIQNERECVWWFWRSWSRVREAHLQRSARIHPQERVCPDQWDYQGDNFSILDNGLILVFLGHVIRPGPVLRKWVELKKVSQPCFAKGLCVLHSHQGLIYLWILLNLSCLTKFLLQVTAGEILLNILPQPLSRRLSFPP